MSHANISVFIPHAGCPHCCSFCDQKAISSKTEPPTAEEAERVICGAFERITDPSDRANTEIAFFGGSFTAIDRDYMISLLKTAEKYAVQGFGGIRISTRPDCVDDGILDVLKKYGVTAIELGAQSMDDTVLAANMRGHTADDVRTASRLIKAHGFELGLQMMTGLYKSSPELDRYTAEEIIALSPDTARIYPVAVLKGTYLERLYLSGEYELYPFEECVSLCADILPEFKKAGIRVIRLGLHAEDGVEKNAAAGYYHPAFGGIVRSELMRRIIDGRLDPLGENIIEAPRKLMSIVIGHKKSNIIYFADKNITVKENNALPKNSILLNGELTEVDICI